VRFNRFGSRLNAATESTGRFDQESLDTHTGELHVSPAVQPVEDAGTEKFSPQRNR
jgi:uncharacterized protein (DUF952 family)